MLSFNDCLTNVILDMTVMNCCECVAEKNGVYYNYFRARYSGEIGIRRELGTESPRESEDFIT